MNSEKIIQSDYGMSEKKLSIYVLGLISCIILTLIAFWAVMANTLSKSQILAIIYSAAIIQFLVQVICFLRLNTKTQAGYSNLMALVFTIVILICIIGGIIWIMWNFDFFMSQ